MILEMKDHGELYRAKKVRVVYDDGTATRHASIKTGKVRYTTPLYLILREENGNDVAIPWARIIRIEMEMNGNE